MWSGVGCPVASYKLFDSIYMYLKQSYIYACSLHSSDSLVLFQLHNNPKSDTVVLQVPYDFLE